MHTKVFIYLFFQINKISRGELSLECAKIPVWVPFVQDLWLTEYCGQEGLQFWLNPITAYVGILCCRHNGSHHNEFSEWDSYLHDLHKEKHTIRAKYLFVSHFIELWGDKKSKSQSSSKVNKWPFVWSKWRCESGHFVRLISTVLRNSHLARIKLGGSRGLLDWLIGHINL